MRIKRRKIHQEIHCVFCRKLLANKQGECIERAIDHYTYGCEELRKK